MTTQNKTFQWIGLAVSITVLMFAIFVAFQVRANPSYFARGTASATATTTLAFMTPGTATTTVTHDAFFEGNNTKADSVALQLMLKASSTGTVLVTNIEYSEDGIDWYQNNLDTYAAGAIAVATPNSLTWTFATSTIGGLLNGGAGVDFGQKVIGVKTPTRYVRAVLSLTGANGGVWVKFIPSKERTEL